LWSADHSLRNAALCDGFLVFIPGVSGLERGVDYPPYLAPRLSFGRAVTVRSVGAWNDMQHSDLDIYLRAYMYTSQYQSRIMLMA